MCVAQVVSPGAIRRRPSPPCAAVNGGGTRRGEIQGADDPRADAQGYTHAAPLGLLRPFITVVK